MIHQLIIVLSMSTLSMCITVKNITTCSSNVKEVRVDSCASEPCAFSRGTTPIINVQFVATSDSSALKASLYAVIAGLQIAAPDFDSDACNDHGIVCPVQKGETYTYSYAFHVLPEYPKIKTTFKLDIKDDNGSDELCFSMPVTVVD